MDEKELREMQNAEIRRREGLEDATCTDPACNGFKCGKRYHLMAYLGTIIAAGLAGEGEHARKADSPQSGPSEDTAKPCAPNCPERSDSRQEEADYFSARHAPGWIESFINGKSNASNGYWTKKGKSRRALTSGARSAAAHSTTATGSRRRSMSWRCQAA